MLEGSQTAKFYIIVSYNSKSFYWFNSPNATCAVVIDSCDNPYTFVGICRGDILYLISSLHIAFVLIYDKIHTP
jgi:hypothetical protein